jgi:superfamily II DNA or RNA helicase/very-short-patch-repair endonuclease
MASAKSTPCGLVPTAAAYPLTLPFRSVARGSELGLWIKTANWSPRILRRRLRSSYSGPCFAVERTFSPSGSRAEEPERAVIRQLAKTNGSGESVKSPESGVPIVQTGVLFQSAMRSFDGIFQDEIVKAGISSWAFIPCFTTRRVIFWQQISTTRPGRKTQALSIETCRRLSLPAALERSRSGNGGHVWLFFEDAVSASLARKLGSHVLTETMERRPEVGFGSYDRLFPNQDTLPKGGFGNLIALPLQKQARQWGNTVFIDEQFKPYVDQWSLLAALRRISRVQVEALVRDAEAKGRVIGVPIAVTDEDDDRPWAAPPSRRYEPPILEPLPESLEKIKTVVRDERFVGIPLNVSFCGALRPEQQAAAKAMLGHDTGVLAATTAFGKTVLTAWLIAQRRVNTLVLVHRRQLMEQWIERLSEFLNVPAKTIGCLGSGRKKLTGMLDVALVQSLVHKGTVDDRIGDYGHLVVDECHHLSARSFELVARRAKARFVTGLSATLARKDGHDPIIFMQCGPVRHRVDAKKQAAARPFTHRVFVRPTGFRTTAEPEDDHRLEFHRLCEELRNDDARNEMICADVLGAVSEGRSPLLLTERTEHVVRLSQRLSDQIPHVITLQGRMGRKELQGALDSLAHISDNVGRVILATGRYIGEGFDDARLDTLFLTLPVSWRGTISQYVGRLHRLHGGKREVRVYDYADLNVPMLARMFDRRCLGYESLGYTILLPASAVSGWPVEVPLPIDPEWKRDYAASVRRLIRDGVEPPLANLFVHAARPLSPEGEGADRARSASEAFLYRRLETLPETAGRFRLNVELPIPFDAWGRMEVDFFCADSRVVVELDGAQHLADAEAYRRDRRRDAMLQQNGYFVLRFLAEDAGKRLDHILDTILATLVHRREELG